jgi:hypothetical protein
MPGNRATVADALFWLKNNPAPKSRNKREHRGTLLALVARDGRG